ncbi:hypothetical protein PLA107_031710 (plasmid) [Pseudomonas amygdali pv. lachrymans str. M301315]|uniref:Uncharacterized protein n=1 Tax=Pseudomonas amygdali pv. lachrymans str. M301315 TaxID=629260 RepID=A0AAD0PW19_PSEAV|nr:hypothetical protein PLA107_031710 [Pseudomonas amygdali pv. lachrymans str. M301315]
MGALILMMLDSEAASAVVEMESASKAARNLMRTPRLARIYPGVVIFLMLQIIPVPVYPREVAKMRCGKKSNMSTRRANMTEREGGG